MPIAKCQTANTHPCPFRAILFLLSGILIFSNAISAQPDPDGFEMELTDPVPAATTDDGFEMELELNDGPNSTAVETVYVTEDGDTIPPESLAMAPFEIEKIPEVVTFVPAEYPADDLKNGTEGTVVMEFIVTDSGRVESLKVVQGVTPGLDSSAITALRQFTFSPAIAGGEPIAVLFQYGYTFQLASETKKIEKYVNFTGVLKERGTRALIPDAMVVLSFPDTVNDPEIKVPWDIYLKKLGSFEGQHVEERRLVTFSDEQGRFKFTSLPSCTVSVSFPVTGYEALLEKEVMEPGKQTDVTYWLKRTSYDEYEIIVFGKAETKEVAKKTLNIYEVKKIPGFGGDAIKVIQALPGVARPSFIGGEIIVRGSGNEDTRYFLDGMQIPILYHFGGLRSTYNSDLLQTIDLYPGGFNTRYGGCIGGVVEIKSRPAKADRWHGNVDVNLIDASFLAEGPINEKMSLTLTGRRSYIANVIKFAVENISAINLPMVVTPYYWDFVGKLDYRKNKDEYMFWTLFTSQDKMKLVLDEAPPGGSTDISDAQDAVKQDIQFQHLLYGYDRTFSDQLKNELRLRVGKEKASFGVFGYVDMDNNSWSYAIRDEVTYKQNDRLTYRCGLDMDWTAMEYTLRILGNNGATRSDVDKVFSVLGAYMNIEYKPLETLTLIPGIRYDYFNEIMEGAPSYRLTSHYELPHAQKLKAAIGTYSQGPRPLGQSIDPEWGNPDLPHSKSNHYVLGYEKEITDLINADMQVYYNTQDQLPTFTNTIRPGTNPARSYNFLPTMDARMYGFELMLRHNQGQRFFGWVSYTLSRSERRQPEVPSDNYKTVWDSTDWFLFDIDQTHIFQALGTWKLGWGFEFGTRLRYVTGNPATPLLGYTDKKYRYNADYHFYEAEYGEFRTDRVGPFFQADMRLDKRFVYKSWIFSMYLDVQNTNYFWYNSPEFYQYNFDNSERRTIGGILIPSLGIKAEF